MQLHPRVQRCSMQIVMVTESVEGEGAGGEEDV